VPQEVDVAEVSIGAIFSNVVKAMIGRRWSAKARIWANYRKIARSGTVIPEIGRWNALS
jgi:hypothetical protein